MSYLTLLRSLESAGTQGDKSDNIRKEVASQILSVLSLASYEDFVAKRTKVLEEIANALAEGAIDRDDAAIANASINNTKDASLLDEWSYLVSCCVSTKQHQ